MPSFSVPLPADVLALMGNYKAAAKAVEKEWNEVQKKIQKDIAAGQQVDRNLAARGASLRQQADSYAERDKRERDADKAADKSITKKLAGALNTHSPHGQLRMIMSGNLNANTIGHLGENIKGMAGNSGLGRLAGMAGGGLSAAAGRIAGVASLAGMGAKLIAEVLETKAEAELEAAKTSLGIQSRGFDRAKSARYQGGADITRLLAENNQQIRRAKAEDHGLIRHMIYGDKDKAHAQSYAEKVAVFKAQYGGRLRPEDLEQLTNYKNLKYTGAVERQLGNYGKGVVGFVNRIGYRAAQAKNVVTGAQDAERSDLAKEQALKTLEARAKSMEDEKKRVEENPAYQFAQSERAREINAWRTFNIERSLQWNAY
jgi:hypothetical protein